MDSSPYIPEKKWIPIVAIVFMLASFVIYAIYNLAYFLPEYFPDFVSVRSFFFTILFPIFLLIGLILIEMSKKNHYGTQKIIRASQIITWILLVVFVIVLVLRFLIKQ